ncbi:MAG: PIN domain-containing protein [Campylobacterota bacterium]|nr:PIN domain-containing protein [Campylobacterota bacterium]
MKAFIDANIILDRYDVQRPYHSYSVKTLEYLITNAELFTSCDLITTIYYVNSRIDNKSALFNIQVINKMMKVVEFSNNEIEEACSLMLEDSDYKDLEDTLQYVMAKKSQCDLIISNDKNFVSKDVEIMSSKEFCEKYIKS